MVSPLHGAFAYDEVPYDTEPNPDAHPRALHTLAHLFGLSTASPSSCRVLEVGCGDGHHLLAAAGYLPGARFVGFDLAGEAIRRGQAFASAAGIDNVTLERGDLGELTGTEHGAFDYVTAHGVYSWVPSALQPKVLSVLKASLAPNGVAFVSFNALPGWHLQAALRRLMVAHAVEGSPAERVARALAVVDGLATLADGPGFAGILGRHAQGYRAHVDAALPPGAPFSRYVFHDLLAEENNPVDLLTFAKDAAAAGLAILAELPLQPLGEGTSPRAESLARHLARKGTPFLQVALVHDHVEAPPAPSGHHVAGLHLVSRVSRAEGGYCLDEGAVLRRAAPALERLLATAAASPAASVPLGAYVGEDQALAGDLLRALEAGVVRLVAEAPPAPTTLPAEPRVSPHTREQARRTTLRGGPGVVVTADHEGLRVGPEDAKLLALLDGSRNAGALADATGRSPVEVKAALGRYAARRLLLP